MKHLKMIAVVLAIVIAGSSFKGFNVHVYQITGDDGLGNFIVTQRDGTCDELTPDDCSATIDEMYIQGGNKLPKSDLAAHGTEDFGNFTPAFK